MTAPIPIRIPADPMARFRELYDALSADRSWFRDANSLRFAALASITSAGTPRQVAGDIRKMADQLKRGQGWFGTLSSPLQFMVGAMLVMRGDTARGFLTEVERARKMFRDASLRRGSVYETIAILVLRIQAGGRPVGRDAVARFQAIYEELKTHHWWLTGPDDFPACAILTDRPETPAAIGARIEGIYQALRREGFSRGDPLQTAANLLFLAKGSPHALAVRCKALSLGFKKAGIRMWQSDYDELAILAFLEHPPARVVDTVVARREEIRVLRPRPDASMSFNLAASVAFLELVQRDRDMGVITDAKALLDMQAILQAQQAAVSAAAASTVVVAANSGS